MQKVKYLLVASVVALAPLTSTVTAQPTVSQSAGPLASVALQATWTWDDFGASAIGWLAGGAAGGAIECALVGTPVGAACGALVGGAIGGVAGAAAYAGSAAYHWAFGERVLPQVLPATALD